MVRVVPCSNPVRAQLLFKNILGCCCEAREQMNFVVKGCTVRCLPRLGLLERGLPEVYQEVIKGLGVTGGFSLGRDIPAVGKAH